MRYPIWLLVLTVPLALAADHRPLVPKPQSVQYGSGSLPLASLSIGFAAQPSAEDRFAAGELAAALAKPAGKRLSIAAAKPAGPAILLNRTGAVDAMPGADERGGKDGREAYSIRIDATGAEIRARSSAGIYYGVQTLRQLVEGKALPFVRIEDWPAMAYRGFMMDTAHGPLPTEDEIKRQIDFLARWKANQYYFYAEANIELRGYELVNPGARYSRDQLRRIIAYARQRHVDVVPCMEFYGHLHDLFRVERYADLGVLPHGGEINPRNPRLQALVKDWLTQLAALFPSPWFHVGLDEPWELEKVGSQAAGGVEPSRLYIDHLKQTTELVRSLGKRPMFWADVNAGGHLFERYPHLFSELPKNAIAVPWYYDTLPDFKVLVEPFAREKVPQVVAPGIWCWQDVVPDYYRTFLNIDGFVGDGRKYGALGVINTGWTDAAQVLYRTALAGMAYGAAAGWQSSPVGGARFFQDYANQMYPAAAAADVAAALDSLSRSQQLLIKALGQETIFRMWDDPLSAWRLKQVEPHLETLRQVRLDAEDAQERLQRAIQATGDNYSLPSLLVGARMLDYAALRYIYAQNVAAYFRRLGDKPSRADVSFWLHTELSSRNHGAIGDLMDWSMQLRDMYAAAWKQEYTDWRLGTALGRWDAEFEYWRRLQARLWDLGRTYRQGGTLPPLDEVRPRM